MRRKKETQKEAQKEPVPLAKKLPAVPESVLKRRKSREAVRAARLKIHLRVRYLNFIQVFLNFSIILRVPRLSFKNDPNNLFKFLATYKSL